MYIWYFSLNYSQSLMEFSNFLRRLLTDVIKNFLPSWNFWQSQKKRAILKKTELIRSPRLWTVWWHSSYREVRPGEFQSYEFGNNRHILSFKSFFKPQIFGVSDICSEFNWACPTKRYQNRISFIFFKIFFISIWFFA